MFGSSSSTSSAQGQSQASINSSGWVVGGGSASGGSLTASTGASIPRAAFISAAVVALSWVYFKSKKKGAR